MESARGKRLAAVSPPAPRGGAATVTLQAGTLGSAGALVEVAAASAAEDCRSLWRLRAGKLHPVPIQTPGGPLRACGVPGEWTTRFERPADDVPATYVRERTRQSSRGPHRETHAFRFSGFQLDLARVTADVGGMAIPDWNDAVLYPRPSVEALFERFDLAPLRTLPRLSINADQGRGVFSLRFREETGVTEIPVRSTSPGPENAVTLSVDGEKGPIAILVRLSRDIPYEVEIRGLSRRLDHLYVPVSRIQEGAFRIYPDAAAELGSNGLPGTWTSDASRTFTIVAAPGALGRIRLDAEAFLVDVERAPDGMDVLLVPEPEKPPEWALDLRGPHSFVRVPVKCASWPAERTCFGTGAGEVWRRVGARINLR